MPSIIITLKSSLLPGAIDLELPDDVPVKHLLPELARALGLPPGSCRLIHRARPMLHNETLSDARVLIGEILTLEPAKSSMPPVASQPSATHYIGSALLTTASGRTIMLNNFGKDEILIGRYDPRIVQMPDIDLTGEPHWETVSRIHAMLRRQGTQWSIVAISNRSPTKVGNNLVPPQQSHPLTSGDEISLGAVKLQFTSPS